MNTKTTTKERNNTYVKQWQKNNKKWLKCYRADKSTIKRSETIYNKVIDALSCATNTFDNSTEQWYTYNEIHSALDKMHPCRGKDIILMRYGLDGNGEKTYRKIGRMLGVSGTRIQQIEKRAIERLRNLI